MASLLGCGSTEGQGGAGVFSAAFEAACKWLASSLALKGLTAFSSSFVKTIISKRESNTVKFSEQNYFQMHLICAQIQQVVSFNERMHSLSKALFTFCWIHERWLPLARNARKQDVVLVTYWILVFWSPVQKAVRSGGKLRLPKLTGEKSCSNRDVCYLSSMWKLELDMVIWNTSIPG